MVPLYEACVRMTRADYCGDGATATRDGTAVEIFDDQGVWTADNLPGFRFEAAGRRKAPSAWLIRASPRTWIWTDSPGAVRAWPMRSASNAMKPKRGAAAQCCSINPDSVARCGKVL